MLSSSWAKWQSLKFHVVTWLHWYWVQMVWMSKFDKWWIHIQGQQQESPEWVINKQSALCISRYSFPLFFDSQRWNIQKLRAIKWNWHKSRVVIWIDRKSSLRSVEKQQIWMLREMYHMVDMLPESIDQSKSNIQEREWIPRWYRSCILWYFQKLLEKIQE